MTVVEAREQVTPKACPLCAHTTHADDRFCARCGAALFRDASLPGETASGVATRNVREPSAALAREAPSRGAADPLVGQVVADRYRIVSLLGRGGMGVVYKVEHIHIGKMMAMKLLSGELARDAATVRRFRAEAKAISKLAHANTVQIFDFGESARLVYLVMEYLPGRDLGSLISSEGPLDFIRAAKICAQVAASVSEAHDRGIVHRDIKPENIMLCDTTSQRDFVKVLDFGIAKLRDSEELSAATQSGHIVGTPYYMAPETIRGEAADPRVDVYALGAVFYKALAGVPPYQSGTPMGVLTMHLTQPLVPVRERASRPELPAEADAIVAKAMEKKPAERYQSMEALREDLLRCINAAGEGDASRPTRSFGPVAVKEGEVLATRGDVDRYERGLARTHWIGRASAVLFILAALYLAVFLYNGESRWRPSSQETEPNDTPAMSNRLDAGNTLHAFLGRRSSRTDGDADVYRIELPAEPRAVDLRVSAIPNIDLVVELVEKGHVEPVLAVDSGRIGEPEAIPNFRVRGGTYYVRVRERFQGVRWPTENLSDPYSIAFKFAAPLEGGEQESNDAFELAETLEPGVARRGLVGWAGDRDLYCFARTSAPAVIEVSPAGKLDLVLTLVDRRSGAEREANARGVGEGEALEVKSLGAAAEPCVEVRAQSTETTARADADHPYTLTLKSK
jgi:serine/threonine protein kinase